MKNHLKYILYKNGSSILFTACFFLLFCSGGTAFAENKMETHTQTLTLKLGATRVIYNPDSGGVTLPVDNPQDYPILIQSQVYKEDTKTKAPFIVTPPLFRLDGQQQSRLRIVRTGGDFAGDRESMQWLCVKAIPPKADDDWAKDKNGKSEAPKNVSVNVQVVMSTCIKLFVRPSGVKGQPDNVAGSVTWEKHGSKLQATNPTPFYINLSMLKVGGIDIKDTHYIPPFSSYTYSIPESAKGKVEWAVITDYGGKSSTFRSEVK